MGGNRGSFDFAQDDMGLGGGLGGGEEFFGGWGSGAEVGWFGFGEV